LGSRSACRSAVADFLGRWLRAERTMARVARSLRLDFGCLNDGSPPGRRMSKPVRSDEPRAAHATQRHHRAHRYVGHQCRALRNRKGAGAATAREPRRYSPSRTCGCSTKSKTRTGSSSRPDCIRARERPARCCTAYVLYRARPEKSRRGQQALRGVQRAISFFKSTQSFRFLLFTTPFHSFAPRHRAWPNRRATSL